MDEERKEEQPRTPPTRAARGEGAQQPGIAVPVSSINPGGAPASPPQNPKVTAFGTINQGVELHFAESEEATIKKLLGGLGLYQNPLRAGAWQIDYRYFAEAKRRLEAAGYQVEGQDFMGRPLDRWDPEKRGWTRTS